MTRDAAAIGAGLDPTRTARSIRPGERIHVVGAAGAGASAAALLASAAGAIVTACDAGGPSPYTAAFAAAGLVLEPRHDPAHVRTTPPPDRLAVTKALTAIDPDHPELRAARELGIAVEPWQQVIADAAADTTLVAVAGTHGKSTTAGWLVHVLIEAGLDPSAFVGALLPPPTGGAGSDRPNRRGDRLRRRGGRVRGQLRCLPAGGRRPHLGGVGSPGRLRRRGGRPGCVRAVAVVDAGRRRDRGQSRGHRCPIRPRRGGRSSATHRWHIRRRRRRQGGGGRRPGRSHRRRRCAGHHARGARHGRRTWHRQRRARPRPAADRRAAQRRERAGGHRRRPRAARPDRGHRPRPRDIPPVSAAGSSARATPLGSSSTTTTATTRPPSA